MKFKEAQELFPKHADLVKANEKMAKAQEKYHEVRDRVRNECAHEVVARYPYTPGTFYNRPAQDVCLCCGLQYGGGKEWVHDHNSPFKKSKVLEVER